jgi:hypothetical protein
VESVPKETETIAHKKALRLSEKLRAARERMGLKNAWWTSRFVESIGLLTLLVVNLILAFPIIGQPAISVSFSGPIIPLLARVVSLSGLEFIYSVQFVNILFFLGFPITYYFFIKFVSKRKLTAFLSVLVVTLPVSIFVKSRFSYELLSGESPYIASLSILPITLIILLKFLREGGIKNLIVGSITTALVALISPFGVFIYVIMSVITTFSEVLLGDGRIKILRLTTMFIFSASLCSFWYNPGFFFWMVTGPLGLEIRQMLSHLIPISFFVIPILTSLGYIIFDRKPNLQPFFLALFYTLTFLVIVMAGGGFVPSNPGRYVPVLGISLAFLIGISVLMIFEYFHFSKLSKIIPISGTKDALLVLVSLTLVVIILTNRNLLINENKDVLGIWANVEKGDIWVARDQFSVQNTIPGYLISLVSVATLVYLYRKNGSV